MAEWTKGKIDAASFDKACWNWDDEISEFETGLRDALFKSKIQSLWLQEEGRKIFQELTKSGRLHGLRVKQQQVKTLFKLGRALAEKVVNQIGSLTGEKPSYTIRYDVDGRSPGVWLEFHPFW